MRVIQPRLHIYQAKLLQMLVPCEAAPQAGAGGATGALTPCRVAVLLEQRTLRVPHAHNAAQVVGGYQHSIVLCASCFDGSNKAVGALDVGEVGYLISNQLALRIRRVVANGGSDVPTVCAWLVVSLLIRLCIDRAACVVEAGKGAVGCYVVGGGHGAKIVKNFYRYFFTKLISQFLC